MQRNYCLCLALTILAGCSQKSTVDAQQSGVSDSSRPSQSAVNGPEAAQAWDQFISKAKSRSKGEAQAAWQRKHENGRLSIDFLHDDVKLDTAREVMSGEVQFKTQELIKVSEKNLAGGYDRAIGNNGEYNLRFRYISGTWRFIDGTRKRTDIHDKSDVYTSGIESLNDPFYFYLKEIFEP